MLVAVQRHRRARLELDQVEHRALAEERPSGHAGGELERLDVGEVDELRLSGPACADCTITTMTHHREEFRVEGMAEPLSHYTDAVKAGGLLFVSGIVPLDADGKARRRGRRRRAGAPGVPEHGALPGGGRLRLRRRGQGRPLPARRRRPPEDQPGADGVLRRGATRVARWSRSRRLPCPARCSRSKRSPLSRAEPRLEEPRSASLGVELERALVGRPRLVVAAEPAEQVGRGWSGSSGSRRGRRSASICGEPASGPSAIATATARFSSTTGDGWSRSSSS